MDPTNELDYLRVSGKKHEIMVAPDSDYILIVIQNQTDWCIMVLMYGLTQVKVTPENLYFC